MRYDDITIMILSTTALFAVVTGFIIYFVMLYSNKQKKNKQEQVALQSAFQQELLKTQIEIQEQTLTYISSEIHDNITQVLSFVKLNLGMVNNETEVNKKKINESRELVSQTINDLRNLSKSLSFEHISSLGLVKTIEMEAERINNSGLINAPLLIEGEVYSLGDQSELVLFRIFQEAFNNTLKYSKAKHFKISLQYHAELFNLTLADDGIGFLADPLNKQNGLGLRNIQNRANLIGAAATIDSSPGTGCSIKVTLNPLKLRLNTDGYHSDRFG
jgi:signal transduction histidine kinase